MWINKKKKKRNSAKKNQNTKKKLHQKIFLAISKMIQSIAKRKQNAKNSTIYRSI